MILLHDSFRNRFVSSSNTSNTHSHTHTNKAKGSEIAFALRPIHCLHNEIYYESRKIKCIFCKPNTYFYKLFNTYLNISSEKLKERFRERERKKIKLSILNEKT